MVYEIVFPEGILAAKKYGKITFNHYTCDRCDFKILIDERFDPSMIK